MRRSPIRSNIRPKISSMPRQKSEAAAYLEVYKLVVEKRRLQQERQSIDMRREQIDARLTVLDQQIQALEGKAHQLRDAKGDDQSNGILQRSALVRHPASDQDSQFKTITLEY